MAYALHAHSILTVSKTLALAVWIGALPAGLSGQVSRGDQRGLRGSGVSGQVRLGEQVRLRGPCIAGTPCRLPYQGEVAWLSSDSILIIFRDGSRVTVPLRSVTQVEVWRENPGAVRGATITAVVTGASLGALLVGPFETNEWKARLNGAVLGALLFGGFGWWISAGIANHWVEVELDKDVRLEGDLTTDGLNWGIRVTF